MHIRHYNRLKCPGCTIGRVKMDQIVFVAILTAVIHLTDTLFYGVRISGVKTKRLATAISLYQIVSLVAMTANMIQAPLLSAVVEEGINNSQIPYQIYLSQLQGGIRLIILAASAGTLGAALLTPVFVFIFNRTIFLFERTGSLPQLILFFLSPVNAWRICRSAGRTIRLKRSSMLHKGLARTKRQLSLKGLFNHHLFPLHLILTNVFVIGIWTTGVLSALYAGATMPNYRSTASLLSGIVNGIAVVLSAFLIDPVTAVITDQALQGIRDEKEMVQWSFWLILSRLLGTVVAQALFLPAVKLVAVVTGLLTHITVH